MAKIAPQLPIEVDSETGVWTSDALPMLYVPRHFFVNNHMGIEEVLGLTSTPRSSTRPATSPPGTGVKKKPSATAWKALRCSSTT